MDVARIVMGTYVGGMPGIELKQDEDRSFNGIYITRPDVKLQLTDEKFKECGTGKEARVCATGSKDRGTTELHEDTRISVKLSSATG